MTCSKRAHTQRLGTLVDRNLRGRVQRKRKLVPGQRPRTSMRWTGLDGLRIPVSDFRFSRENHPVSPRSSFTALRFPRLATNDGNERQDDVPAAVDGAWQIALQCQIMVCGVHVVLDGYEALHDVQRKRVH